MQPQAHPTYSDMEGEEESSIPTLVLRAIDAESSTAFANAAAPEAIVAIELNFNAFADDVPPTQHAKRVATQHDPSIQDFADQALEISALRAELKRLNRDFNGLQQTVRLREAQVRSLREQLASVRAQVAGATPYVVEQQSGAAPSEISEVTLDLSASPPLEVATANVIQPARTAVATPNPPSLRAAPAVATPNPPSLRAAPLEQDVTSTVVLARSPLAHNSAPITEAPKVEQDSTASAPARKLIPEGREGQTVLLSRDIMTIGRTKQNDICILSRGVSRDHARLLLSTHSVTLFDMGSENGCFVNGERVKRHKLRDGDIIRIGDRAYRFADSLNSAQRTRANL